MKDEIVKNFEIKKILWSQCIKKINKSYNIINGHMSMFLFFYLWLKKDNHDKLFELIT